MEMHPFGSIYGSVLTKLHLTVTMEKYPFGSVYRSVLMKLPFDCHYGKSSF